MAKKSPGFLGKFYQIFKENLMSINFNLLNFDQKVGEDGRLSDLPFEASTAFTPKPNRDTIRKETSLTSVDHKSSQNAANLTQLHRECIGLSIASPTHSLVSAYQTQSA